MAAPYLMPTRLHRYYGADYLHYITTGCYQRFPWLVMPEHVHLLLSEPEQGDPSIVMQVLKQGFARKLLRELRTPNSSQQGPRWATAISLGHIWQRRFYDFVVSTEHKRMEKLRYMHRNPVKRGLVLNPDQWRWSSYRDYAHGQCGRVLVNEQKPAKLKVGVAG